MRLWIVVADAGRAIVLSKTQASGSPVVLHELKNPAGRLHTSELVSDRRGRISKKGGQTRSALEPRTDPHDHNADNFATEICALLDDAAERRAFDLLIFFAPARFLGLLQAKLGKPARKRIAMCDMKDLTRATIAELEKHIDGLGRLPSMTERSEMIKSF